MAYVSVYICDCVLMEAGFPVCTDVIPIHKISLECSKIDKIIYKHL